MRRNRRGLSPESMGEMKGDSIQKMGILDFQRTFYSIRQLFNDREIYGLFMYSFIYVTGIIYILCTI